MIVVADTWPINYLVLTGYEFVLPRLYGEVLIPSAVCAELNDPDAPEAVRRWIASPPGWIGIQAQAVPVPQVGSLGAGESAGIALAMAIKADLILIDDAVARREATSYGLTVTGTLGVLRDSAQEGLLNLEEALTRLRATNFHVGPHVLEHLLKEK